MTTTDKRTLFLLRQAPYGNSLARTAIDACLASAAFDQQPKVLFMGKGILQLLPGQDGAAAGTRTLSKIIDSFELYDIETLYIDGASLAPLGLTPDGLPGNCEILDEEGIKALLDAADHVVSF